MPRGHLAELGIVSAKGRNGTAELLRIIADGRVSPAVCGILKVLTRQYVAIGAEIASSDKGRRPHVTVVSTGRRNTLS